MRVLHLWDPIVTESSFHKMLTQLVEKLNNKEIEFRIVDLNRMTHGEQSLSKNQKFDFKLIRSIVDFLKKEKADILHTHDIDSLNLGGWAAQLSGVRTVHTQHARSAQKMPFSSRFYSFIVCSCQDVYDNITSHQYLPANKLRVINDGVDVSIFSGEFSRDSKLALRRKLGLREDSFLLGNTCPLTSEEEQATILKSFRRLLARKLNFELVLLGKGPKRKELEDLAQEFQVLDRTKFIEEDDISRSILKALDVFILSSYREDLSFDLLEAMACSKAVVATKIGNNPEIVIDGETGLLVPCAFPERMEAAIMRYYANRTWAAQLGEAARNRVFERFNLDRTAEQYEKLYREVLL